MTHQIAISVQEAAKAAGVGRTTIFMALRSRRLKCRKIGRRTVILIEDLKDWLASLPCGTANDGGEENEAPHRSDAPEFAPPEPLDQPIARARDAKVRSTVEKGSSGKPNNGAR